MTDRIRILFVCGRNRKRSPTAERIYAGDPRFEVRSGGTAETSRRRVAEGDLRWANVLIVMEDRYADRLESRFSHVNWPPVVSLDIPDDYEFMDPELIELVRGAVEGWFQGLTNGGTSREENGN